MRKVWNEAAIRREIAKLDKKTGLNGAALPIRFNYSFRKLGTYHGKEGYCYFTFSKYYYDNPDWPEEEAIDTIRHEYAHYMDHMIFGNLGHRTTWKICCSRIGAAPYSRSNPDKCRLYWDNIAMEKKIKVKKIIKKKTMKKKYEQYAASSIGRSIEHPGYGTGVITAVTGDKTNCRVTIGFPDAGSKTLSLAWVDENCRMIG